MGVSGYKMDLQTSHLNRRRHRMLLKTILNRVEPFKSFVYGKARWVEEPGD